MGAPDDFLIVELGKRISSLRREKSLTQAQLSDLVEMEESALRRIELGGTNPTFKTLLRLSKGLEVPLKELLDIPLP
ncbi:MAG: helix-turn-helix domain-containing protein [Flavobacteriaceae bacterium]|nr:helix-turn-helix domain-containing protein [Flavobacteriaceae bacterium]